MTTLTIPTAIEVIGAALAVGLQPDPIIDPVRQAERVIVLPDGPDAGSSWNPRKTPFWTEPLRCLSPDDPCNRVSVRKSAQVGASILGAAWLGCIVTAWPANAMVVQPTIDGAKAYVTEKLQPVIDASKRLKRRVADLKSRSGEGSTTLRKRYPGGFMVFAGANSSAGLRSRTVKFAFCDEVDEWPVGLGKQGDPMGMVEARQMAFKASRDWKRFEISTPVTKGASRIDTAFEDGDQREYRVPCPHCGAEQALEWPRLEWSKSWPHNARYACAECGVLIEHYHKDGMLRRGRWVAMNPGPGRHPSFRINTLYSPFVTWNDMVAAFVAAEGDQEKMKTWWNLWLGESWEERGEAPPVDRLMERRQTWKMRQLPPGVLFLTGAADVQADRVEWDVFGWGVGMTCWHIDSGVIAGSPDDPKTWRDLDAVADATYPDARGRLWSIDAFGCDAGYRSTRVYAWSARRGATGKAFALDGRDGWRLPPIGTPTKKDVDFEGRKIGSTLLWPVGTWDQKSELYAALTRTMEGPGPDGRWPIGSMQFSEGVDRTWLEQLTAEYLKAGADKRGRPMLVWVNDRSKRNERHDIAVYARALAHHLSDSLTAEAWQDLAARRDVTIEDVQRDLSELWLPALGEPAPDSVVSDKPAETTVKREDRSDADPNWFGGRTDDYWH